MSDDTDQKVRSAIGNAIYHLETIESGLEPFDAGKNREARRRLEDALERLREDERSTSDTDRSEEVS